MYGVKITANTHMKLFSFMTIIYVNDYETGVCHEIH